MLRYARQLLAASTRHQAAFAALCVQRVLPIYRHNAPRTRSIEADILRVLDAAWAHAAGAAAGPDLRAALDVVTRTLEVEYEEVITPQEEAAAQVVTAAKRLGTALVTNAPPMFQAAIEACLEAASMTDENETGMAEEEELWQAESLTRVLRVPQESVGPETVTAAAGADAGSARWLERWDR